MAKNFDQAYKLEICKRVVENKESVAVVAREVGIHENTIYGWVSRYRQNSNKPFVGSGRLAKSGGSNRNHGGQRQELRHTDTIKVNTDVLEEIKFRIDIAFTDDFGFDL
ncbi:Transposase [Acididesulfobacillus acetoxydans]|uniref:Transposase n=1 Tax=Acididesulfobacillus acetoxydans TaxID=1561005 RepID=A0A8S0XDE3_9FIRM|nr:transposase [Acididesulfobacillus acetoxydans]CAA7603436.1 Transposase [Acididesulfobacillus acetoxydans]CEJ07149.1 Transposase [Acididesulfobacillus acetoxydans]